MSARGALPRWRAAVVALLFVAGMAGLAGPAAAADARQTAMFGEANDLYSAAKYEEAAQRYLQILDTGVVSAALHYNLGNAYFKSGRLGPAVLHYEKALALAPSDMDIRANLDFARRQTADKTSEGGARSTAVITERILALCSMDQAAVFFLAAYLVTAVLAGCRIMSYSSKIRRVLGWGIALCAIPLLLSGGFFGAKLYRESALVEAIVVDGRVDVRSGPDEDNTTLFTVHEGLKVRVRSETGSWTQISLDNGLSGWMPAAALGVI